MSNLQPQPPSPATSSPRDPASFPPIPSFPTSAHTTSRAAPHMTGRTQRDHQSTMSHCLHHDNTSHAAPRTSHPPACTTIPTNSKRPHYTLHLTVARCTSLHVGGGEYVHIAFDIHATTAQNRYRAQVTSAPPQYYTE